MSAVSIYLASLVAQQAINQSTSDQGGGVTLALGDITFQSIEIPERLSGIGGHQTLAVHDFPGGVRTIQAMGAFPDLVPWEGWLSGTTAMQRSQQIDRLRATGQQVTLTYGAFSWTGYVREYLAEARTQFLIRYKISFQPQADLSGSAAQTTPAQSNNAMLFSSVTALSNLIAGSDGLSMPASLVGPSTALVTLVQQSLASANGDVAGFSTETVTAIGTASQNVVSAATPLAASTDATQGSVALDTANQAVSIQTLSANPQQPLAQEVVTNPNLFNLAAAYYGDATLWDYIGEANGLTDPTPVGQYTLTIPPNPNASSPSNVGAGP